MQFLVVEGTVREGRKSIHAARYVRDRLGERGHDVTLVDMEQRDFPLLRERRYRTDHPDEHVEWFGRQVEACDGLIIISPEYNHMMPGALKNLLDHLYPEYEDTPFSFVTVSGGGFGGVRLQEDLNRFTVTVKAHPGPSLPVSNVGDVFSDDGDLVDDQYQDRFADWLDRVESHTERYA